MISHSTIHINILTKLLIYMFFLFLSLSNFFLFFYRNKFVFCANTNFVTVDRLNMHKITKNIFQIKFPIAPTLQNVTTTTHTNIPYSQTVITKIKFIDRLFLISTLFCYLLVSFLFWPPFPFPMI